MFDVAAVWLAAVWIHESIKCWSIFSFNHCQKDLLVHRNHHVIWFQITKND